MKKIAFFVLTILCLEILEVSPAYAYVNVKGYYRSNGTYVQPYVRSNPNGLKYDNYSWKPSQGLYNKSYYGGSTYWQTPTWTTDSKYYEGKYLYENKLYTTNKRPKGVSKREFKKMFNINR